MLACSGGQERSTPDLDNRQTCPPFVNLHQTPRNFHRPCFHARNPGSYWTLGAGVLCVFGEGLDQTPLAKKFLESRFAFFPRAHVLRQPASRRKDLVILLLSARSTPETSFTSPCVEALRMSTPQVLPLIPGQSMLARAVRGHKVRTQEFGEILSSPTHFLPEVWDSTIRAASEASHLTSERSTMRKKLPVASTKSDTRPLSHVALERTLRPREARFAQQATSLCGHHTRGLFLRCLAVPPL